MGAFKSAVITKKGQELLAKVVAGTTKLEFTKIKVSDAKLSGDLASMTGIGTIKQYCRRLQRKSRINRMQLRRLDIR